MTMRPPTSRCLLAALAGFLTVAGTAYLGAAEPRPAESFAQTVTPFVQQHCIGCHGAAKQSGKLRLDGPAPDFRQAADLKLWENVRKQLASGAMPPEGRTAPRAEELAPVLDWISSERRRATVARHGGTGRRPLRRLTGEEYSNTIRDLLGLHYAGYHLRLGDRLPPDGQGASFSNDAETLSVQPLHLQQFFGNGRADPRRRGRHG